MRHKDVVGNAAIGEIRRGGYEEIFDLDMLGEGCQARGCGC
jgi:hypothetical protein